LDVWEGGGRLSFQESRVNIDRTILSLCDFSGVWSQPYVDAGYHVIRVDLKRGMDARLIEHISGGVHGILAAPDCNAFAGSGAQYWPAKDADGRTLAGLALVDACLRAVAIYQPAWWALENPVGRLRRWIGPPRIMFNPCDFAGHASNPAADAYTKKTCLWGQFTPPRPHPIEPVKVCSQGSWIMQLGGSSERTKELRSRTPEGFARAFFEANP
jgi:hypothetical protein